jgi:hypothetical protein
LNYSFPTKALERKVKSGLPDFLVTVNAYDIC